MDEELDLGGQVAVVTGGGTGVGRLLAEQLALAGAAVAIVGRTEATLLAVAAALCGDGATVLPVVADVCDDGASDAALATVRRELGPVDLLVNNAGIAALGAVTTVDPARWWEAFELHVQAPMRWCRAVVPEMVGRGGGRIVNVSSTAAVSTIPGASAYVASKAAVSAFTRVLQAEQRRTGVRVFAFAPRLETDMTAQIASSPDMPASWRDAAAAVPAKVHARQRERTIALFRRIVSGALDDHAGEHLESEQPPLA